jgi:glycosidase
MKHLLSLTLLIVLLLPQGYTQQDSSIYNDDPMQKRAIGVEESEYRVRVPNGGPVTETRIEPPNWWVGMRDNQLQLLIYDEEIGTGEVQIDYPGVTVQAIHRVENPNYLFVDLLIGPATPAGEFPITLTAKGEERTYTYELQKRLPQEGRLQGLTSEDLIYLIMPDRFANGDPGNDGYPDMNQSGINRDKVFFRHGGDLLGVMEHLDYLEELGVTALWLNPVLENDQPYESYHGYAITDHYEIDKRFGTNEQYRQLVELCHERGMKVIMDVIHNHVGDEHWFIRDLPTSDWIHQETEHLRKSNFRETALVDPHASAYDKEQLSDGWFDAHMPDLNQRNPYLAKYLTQNAIWWNEFSGHDAYRIDTYFYPDQDFMYDWARRLNEEYDDFSFFGETWVQGYSVQAQFTENSAIRGGVPTDLPAVTDFQLFFAIQEVLAGQEGWTQGTARLYYTLAHDYLYEDAYRNVIFLDNHDLARYFTVVGEDMDRYKMGLAFLLTTRGIPMIYYGTEILLSGSGGGFGEGGRKDFPGGWEDDYFDKFRAINRTAAEQEAFTFVKTLANYRKSSNALTRGKLIHFIPDDGVYVYFRQGVDATVMVLLNARDEEQVVDTERYQEILIGFTGASDVVTGESYSELNEIEVPGRSTLVLELRK